MAKLPRIKRLLKEDFQEVEWIDKLLGPVNDFFDTVYDALNKGLTFTDNMPATVKTLEFKEGSSIYPIKFAWNLKTLPTALIITRVVGTEPSSAPSVYWSFDGQSINIDKFYGLVDGQDYKVSVIAFTA